MGSTYNNLDKLVRTSTTDTTLRDLSPKEYVGAKSLIINMITEHFETRNYNLICNSSSISLLYLLDEQDVLYETLCPYSHVPCEFNITSTDRLKFRGLVLVRGFLVDLPGSCSMKTIFFSKRWEIMRGVVSDEVLGGD
ncbi:hypothetical protein Smp_066640 [Schistosoma mansoni]|uniref:hypothetical protein n=1 Tax=Schistosoma mansoni TaxID=6183 RepID=UPI0001A62707|nr:hypothetical protein Smp_066640 [Schistosoma mansoni]|eukprot:XP_018645260.1 hypothetical protein Smp_066640 [Schistosoma mansoni]